MVSSEAMPYNLLNEPSPLGLRLRKSPSLVDLIQMRLSQANGEPEKTKESKPTGGGLASSEKLKASNFPASLLKIGDWEVLFLHFLFLFFFPKSNVLRVNTIHY